ncbi:MAG: tripeptide aminopeptidase PepT, partial [Gemmatimonadaceae bacterium]
MPTDLEPPGESVVDRFLRYVRIDTQSREDQHTTPSTFTQWTLANLLAAELKQMGASDVALSEHCMVYATVPSNLPNGKQAPTVGFIAHVDTSPAVTGAGVNPIVHRNYRGGDIALPGDPAQVITVAQHPVLNDLIGDDIITTDGTTLLGSDDKAGVAAIMTLVDVLLRNPGVPHGRVRVAFTADEEIGTGIEQFDVAAFDADFAYTVDGSTLGEVSDETWNARLATITFVGKSAHPGTAKGVMV